jgi:hypothetical protein
MSATLLTGIAFGVAVGAFLIIVRNVIAARRAKQAAARTIALRMFAAKRGFTLLSDHVPERAGEIARVYRGEEHRVQLEDLLLGSDPHGTYYICMRRVAGTRHHALLFETRIQGLEDCRIEPVRRAAGDIDDDDARGFGALLRRVGSVFAAMRGRPRPPRRLRLTWEVNPTRMDARAAALAPQLLSHVAAVTPSSPGVQLHLELHRQKAIVHSLRPAYRGDLQAFVDAAMQLRQRTLDALLSGARETPSRVFTPVVDEPARPQPAAGRTRSGAALPANGSSKPASGSSKPATESSKPVNGRFAFKPIDPANITSADLVREVQPEHSAQGKGGSGADAGEDELVVLSGFLGSRM